MSAIDRAVDDDRVTCSFRIGKVTSISLPYGPSAPQVSLWGSDERLVRVTNCSSTSPYVGQKVVVLSQAGVMIMIGAYP